MQEVSKNTRNGMPCSSYSATSTQCPPLYLHTYMPLFMILGHCLNLGLVMVIQGPVSSSPAISPSLSLSLFFCCTAVFVPWCSSCFVMVIESQQAWSLRPTFLSMQDFHTVLSCVSMCTKLSLCTGWYMSACATYIAPFLLPSYVILVDLTCPSKD